jgi:hypothetical protein
MPDWASQVSTLTTGVGVALQLSTLDRTTGPKLNATGDVERNVGSNWTASNEAVGMSTGVGGKSEVEEETEEDEYDDWENFEPGMWK